MSSIKLKLNSMEVQKILMDIHKNVGRHSGLLEYQGGLLKEVHADTKETRRQATLTNGRVNNIEENVVPAIRGEIDDLRDELMQLKSSPIEKGLKLTWDKITIFLGAIAVIIAAVIQHLWK